MRFFRLLHPQWRWLFFGLAAEGLQVLLALVSPMQLPVVLYKLAFVTLAAIGGIFFDVAAFPFAAPSSCLDDDWKRVPIADQCRLPFIASCLRRAVAAVSVGALA